MDLGARRDRHAAQIRERMEDVKSGGALMLKILRTGKVLELTVRVL